MSKKVIFIGEYKFPMGDAASVRTYHLAKMALNLGYNPVVIGKGKYHKHHYCEKNKEYYYKKVNYVSMGVFNKQKKYSPLYIYKRLKITITHLKKYHKEDIEVVVVNACSGAKHVPWIFRYCKKNKISVIGDICEYYSYRHFKFGILNSQWILFYLIFHTFIKKLENYIFVSSYLENLFTKHAKNFVRIEAPYEVDEAQKTPYKIRKTNLKNNDSSINIIYAGSPGKKDLLYEFINCLCAYKNFTKNINLDIYGITFLEFSQLNKNAENLSYEGNHHKITFHGRVSLNNIKINLKKSHYSLLLRKDETFSKAGFPSKVAESLAHGVPVICNYTSDMRRLLSGENCLVHVLDETPNSIGMALTKLSSISDKDYFKLRKNALKAAKRHFSLEAYTNKMHNVINQCRNLNHRHPIR
jgi:glycosyltransferase involved in cell wall biosynthesis